MSVKDEIKICSFDIGEKNFCVSITSISLVQLQSLKTENIPLRQRYDKNGECLDPFAKLLQKVSVLGKRTFIDKCDITQKDDKKYKNRRVVTNRMLVRLTNYLEDLNLAGTFEDISYFIIEKQLKMRLTINRFNIICEPIS